MTKKHLKLLEKVFAAEIEGRLPYQSKAKGYKELEELDLVAWGTVTLGGGGFPVTVSGWYLTHSGRYAYCESCKDVVIDDAEN